MERLRTATGKEFDCDYFNPCPPVGQTNIRILNTDIATIAVVFSDPAETKQLWCENMYAAHYSKLVAIVPEGDAIRVVLGKE